MASGERNSQASSSNGESTIRQGLNVSNLVTAGAYGIFAPGGTKNVSMWDNARFNATAGAIAGASFSTQREVTSQDCKDFLDRMKEHSINVVQYAVRGNRKNLKEPTRFYQPDLKIIEMEGLKSEEMDGESLKGKKPGPIGKDIASIELNQIHMKLEHETQQSDIRHVLLIGSAGEGKSTLAKKYAQAVIRGDCLEGIELVLFIAIIEVGIKETTAFDLLVSNQLRGVLEARQESAGKKWMEENPSKMLIVFDGLDQSHFSLQRCLMKTNHKAITDPATIISNILCGHIYPGAKILSTSRWQTFWTLQDTLGLDRIAALRGFSDQQVEDLISQVLPSNADSVLDHLRNKAPNLLLLCSTPNILLNAAAVLSQSPDIWQDTQTEILVYMAKYLLQSKTSPNDPKLVKKLARLAFFCIKSTKFSLTSSDLRDFGLVMSDLSDFINTDALLIPYQTNVREGDCRCYFYHQTIQELFATLHICIESDINVDKLFEEANMENVLLFLHGIVCHKKTFSMVRHLILNDTDVMRDDIEGTLRERLGKIFGTPSRRLHMEICNRLQECDTDFVKSIASNVKEAYFVSGPEPRDSFTVSVLVSRLDQLRIVEVYNLELNHSTVAVIASIIDSKHLKVEHLTLSSSLTEDHESDTVKVLQKAEFSLIVLKCVDCVARFSLKCFEKKEIVAIDSSNNRNLHHSTYRLMTAAAPSRLLLNNCSLKKEDVEELIIGLEDSRGVHELEELDLSQDTPNPEEQYLPVICKLFDHVSQGIDLSGWSFDDDQRNKMVEKLQTCRFRKLRVIITRKHDGRRITL